MNAPITIDPAEMVKAEWLQKRDELLVQADSVIEVSNQQQFEYAAKIQSAITKHAKQLNAARLDVTRKIDDIKKDIMAQERSMVESMEGHKDRLRTLNKSYAQRIEMQRQKAEAELEEKRRQAAADAVAQEQRVKELFGDEATLTAAPTEPPVTIPAVPLPKSKSVTVFTVTKHEVVDVNKLPREYMIVNDRAIKAAIKAQQAMGHAPAIPGVRIWTEKDVRSR